MADPEWPLGLAWMGLEEGAGTVHFDEVVGEGSRSNRWESVDTPQLGVEGQLA